MTTALAILEPNIVFSPGCVAPDRFSSTGWPDDFFVVSRKNDGSVASRYGDSVWDFSAYHPAGRPSRLYLSSWNTGPVTAEVTAIIGEIRQTLFLLLWVRHGSAFSLNTIYGYFRLLRDLARFARENAISIQKILSESVVLHRYLEASSNNLAPMLRSLLIILAGIGEDRVGYRVQSNAALAAVDRASRSYCEGLRQHPPIPTRIYSGLIAGLVQAIDGFQARCDDYFRLITDCLNNPLIGRSKRSQTNWHRRQSLDVPATVEPLFSDLLVKHSLADYFESEKLVPNTMGLAKGLTNIQLVCKLLLQCYSGMRNEEATSLLYDCIEVEGNSVRKHFFVYGNTTKLNNGNVKRTRWVTSKDGAAAVRMAQRICDGILSALHSKEPSIGAINRNNIPLFISASYLRFAGRLPQNSKGEFACSRLDTFNMTELFERLLLPITETDIRELEEIDPHRAWRNEDAFQLGRRWTLTSHQLRRSLALYASKSGLVSLPSLRRQLQHITEEMSRYYARGSQSARDIIGENSKHFAVEWQETQPVSSALSYIAHVLLSDETLFGGHANWVNTRLRGTDGNILVDREATIKRFQKGEIAYRETPLGGCTNIEGCQQEPLRWIDVECLSGCRNLVCNPTKLDRVIDAQSRLVASITQGTVEHRMELADLDDLMTAKNRVLRKLDGSTDQS